MSKKHQRKMPSRRAVRRYWQTRGCVTGLFTCMGCGWTSDEDNLDRAHVVPRCEGGPDAAENLVLVCGVCGVCHIRTDGWTLKCWELRLFGGPDFDPLFAPLIGDADKKGALISRRTKAALARAKIIGTKSGRPIGNPRIAMATEASRMARRRRKHGAASAA